MPSDLVAEGGSEGDSDEEVVGSATEEEVKVREEGEEAPVVAEEA